MSLQTFILQGEVAEYPNDEDISVGETWWHLQEIYTLTGIFALSEKHQTAVWSILLGNAKISKLEKLREILRNSFLVWDQKYNFFVYQLAL